MILQGSFFTGTVCFSKRNCSESSSSTFATPSNRCQSAPSKCTGMDSKTLQHFMAFFLFSETLGVPDTPQKTLRYIPHIGGGGTPGPNLLSGELCFWKTAVTWEGEPNWFSVYKKHRGRLLLCSLLASLGINGSYGCGHFRNRVNSLRSWIVAWLKVGAGQWIPVLNQFK